MVNSKTTIIIQGFREVPTFTRWGGVQLFQGDQNANFYRNGYTVNLVLVRTVKNNYFPLCTN